MTAPNGNYGYEDGMLLAVISATDEALSQMNTVNSNVIGISSQLPMVNNSDSGIKLGGLLGDWSTDYNKILNQLTELNGRVKHLLNINRTTTGDATGAAQ